MEFACNNLREYLLSQPAGKDFDAKAVSWTDAHFLGHQHHMNFIWNTSALCQFYHGKCIQNGLQYGSGLFCARQKWIPWNWQNNVSTIVFGCHEIRRVANPSEMGPSFDAILVCMIT